MPGDWDYLKALEIARGRIAASSGQGVADVVPAGDNHIGKARDYLGRAAPALAELQMALTLGTTPEELDRVRGGARIILESIKQAHAVVGLRAGEEVSVDISERMQGFLTKWQERRELSTAEREPVESHPQVIDGEARRVE